MRFYVLFLLSFSFVSAQLEVNRFDINQQWKFAAQFTFSNPNGHYVLGASQSADRTTAGTYDDYAHDGLTLLYFDNEYSFVKKRKLALSEAHLGGFELEVLEMIEIDSNSYALKMLGHDDAAFYVLDGTLNLETSSIDAIETRYNIPLADEYKARFVQIGNHEDDYHIMQLVKDTKTLHVYSLDEEGYREASFPLEKEYYKRLRPNFSVLQQMDSNAQSELDLTPGHQFYVTENHIYILTGDCVKEGPSLMSLATAGNCATSAYFFSDLHLLNLDLKEKSMDAQIIDPTGNRTKMAFSIVDDHLFYTIANKNRIIVTKMNLADNKKENLIINEEKLMRNNIDPVYTNYFKDASKIKREIIDFKKLYAKFKKSPALAVEKVGNEQYALQLGNVKYKAYNSFGDWLGAFAMATISATATANATGGNGYFFVTYFKNEIPKIYKASLQTDFDEKIVTYDSETATEKDVILQNLDYFIKKRFVSPLGTINGSKVALFTNTKNFRRFYVVNLEP